MSEAEDNAALVKRIIDKYIADREVIKAVKARQAEELRALETFQSKREAALLERAGIEAFGFMTDLFLNGRNGKAEEEKKKEDISLNQRKIEQWLLKNLNAVGESIKTKFGTVYKTRSESVTCKDFELFVSTNMVKPAVEELLNHLGPTGAEYVVKHVGGTEELALLILNSLHLELLTKAVRKESCLEIMGEPAEDGSRPNKPPAGVEYVAIQKVGVLKK